MLRLNIYISWSTWYVFNLKLSKYFLAPQYTVHISCHHSASYSKVTYYVLVKLFPVLPLLHSLASSKYDSIFNTFLFYICIRSCDAFLLQLTYYLTQWSAFLYMLLQLTEFYVLYDWMIFHCVCSPHFLYSVISWWKLK